MSPPAAPDAPAGVEADPPAGGAPRRALAAWAFYDWANSAFATMIQTFVFAAYFTRSIAADETSGTALWGNATAAAGLLVAVGGPVLGAVADQTGRRKPWLGGFTALAVLATAALWLILPSGEYLWPSLLLVGIGIVGAEFAVIFYNAMLPDLAPGSRVGRWSGWGWALGYMGGLGCLVVALVGFVGENPWLELDRESAAHVRATFLLTAAWFGLFALPLFALTPDAPASGKRLLRAARDGLAQLRESLRNARRYAGIVRFLVARMIYIDGLATLFAFGGVYAAGSFDMTEQQVLVFGIALNVTAGLGALGFSWIDDWLGSRATILVSLAGLIVTSGAILLVHSQPLFWAIGMVLGIFVGPVQAASRSYLARSAPPRLCNEMFGLFAFSGKATAFVGPLLVGWVTWLAASQRVGMSVIVVFFVVGAALMLTVPDATRRTDQALSP